MCFATYIKHLLSNKLKVWLWKKNCKRFVSYICINPCSNIQEIIYEKTQSTYKDVEFSRRYVIWKYSSPWYNLVYFYIISIGNFRKYSSIIMNNDNYSLLLLAEGFQGKLFWRISQKCYMITFIIHHYFKTVYSLYYASMIGTFDDTIWCCQKFRE